MWTLLWEAARLNGFHDATGPSSHANGTGARAATTAATERSIEPKYDAGATPARAGVLQPSSSAPPLRNEVRIYMHPGRMAVGEMDLARASEQFDLQAAERFATLEEAEPACAGRTGFLLELRDAGRGIAGAHASSAVLFVEGLRG